GAGVSGAGVSGAPTAAPPSSSVVLTARSRASCPTTGLRPPVRRFCASSRTDVTGVHHTSWCAARHSALVRLPYTASTGLSPLSHVRAGQSLHEHPDASPQVTV